MAFNLTNFWRKLAQWGKNFIWGVNDTLNLPTVAIWDIWAFLSPKWSQAERNFKNLADSARYASDIWQDYNSAGYLVSRFAPWAALTLPLLAASSPVAIWALWVGGTLGLELPSLATMWSLDELWFGGADARNRVRQEWDWGPWHWAAPESQQVQNPVSMANTSRKAQIARTLRGWQNAWIDLTDPSVAPIVRNLISEYNSL